jgi:hypothetical protein
MTSTKENRKEVARGKTKREGQEERKIRNKKITKP